MEVYFWTRESWFQQKYPIRFFPFSIFNDTYISIMEQLFSFLYTTRKGV